MLQHTLRDHQCSHLAVAGKRRVVQTQLEPVPESSALLFGELLPLFVSFHFHLYLRTSWGVLHNSVYKRSIWTLLKLIQTVKTSCIYDPNKPCKTSIHLRQKYQIGTFDMFAETAWNPPTPSIVLATILSNCTLFLQFLSATSYNLAIQHAL